jgi:hypothetical protein
MREGSAAFGFEEEEMDMRFEDDLGHHLLPFRK